MSLEAIAYWIAVAGGSFQLIGSLMTLWSLLSAAQTLGQQGRALVGALWRSPKSRLAASLSELNEADRSRVLQGVAFLALGYLLALASQVWLFFLNR